ncbi:MAG: lipid-A-disaccharide synthase-like uncharacterized protein [Planctomycetota bacterium]|jgi:lipid-A-disaccharide synthase-like uncharacterized protein
MPDSWFTTELVWITIGVIGQGFFFTRFVVQWIASERAKRSVVPDAFWWLSIVGSLIMLCYAIYRKDPIFILAFTPNVFIYSRNLYLLKKERDENAAITQPADPTLPEN